MAARLAILLSLLALGLAGCGGDEAGDGGADEAATADVIRTIRVAETEFELEPATIALDQPGTYVFRAVNEGQTEHALEVEGEAFEERTENLAPGESAELRVELTEPGEYELYCPVGDHKDRGMDGTVTVGGAAGGAGGTTDTTATTGTGTRATATGTTDTGTTDTGATDTGTTGTTETEDDGGGSNSGPGGGSDDDSGGYGG